MSQRLARTWYHLVGGELNVRASTTRSGVVFKPDLIYTDLDIADLARRAQEVHEKYLSENSTDEDEPGVDERGTLLNDEHKPNNANIGEDCQSMSEPGWKKLSKDKLRFKVNRRNRRQKQWDAEALSKRIKRVLKGISKKHQRRAKIVHSAYEIPSSVRGTNSRVAATAFVGSRMSQDARGKAKLTKKDALALGLQEIEWDGKTRIGIAEGTGKILCSLYGQPEDGNSWAEVQEEVREAYKAARETYRFERTQLKHRRGEYAAITAGISYGGGQQRVANLSQSAHNREVVEGLLNCPGVQRLAGFADSAFLTSAPDMYVHYAETIAAVLDNDPTLRPNFRTSVFAGVTFNLGPQVSTYVHTDHLNLPSGWCAVVALGDFDPKEGGHLILWDLNLMIQFPPGSLILLPSALLQHSNTVVRPHEERYSFTQYTAGGIFRWVECGFRSQKEFLAGGGKYGLDAEGRWRQGLEKFCTVSTWCE